MTHYAQKDDETPEWPIGSFIVIVFPDDGDDFAYIARAALIRITNDLKDAIEKAAKSLADNPTLRGVQFYWEFDVITNEIYGQPIPKEYVPAIKELLDADFSTAIPDATACNAFQRMCSLEAITWITVCRPPLLTGGAIVSLGCTAILCDSSTTASPLKSETRVPVFDKEIDKPKQLVRAIEDLHGLTSQD